MYLNLRKTWHLLVKNFKILSKFKKLHYTDGNIKFHINSVSIQLTWSIFLDFFHNIIFDDKSEDGPL